MKFRHDGLSGRRVMLAKFRLRTWQSYAANGLAIRSAKPLGKLKFFASRSWEVEGE